MSTSKRLKAWIVELNLYREFWEFVRQRHGKHVTNIVNQAKYQKLAIEFLQEHFLNLSKDLGISLNYKRPAHAAESMVAFNEFAERLRAEAQDYAKDASRRAENSARKGKHSDSTKTQVSQALSERIQALGDPDDHEARTKPTDPWGAPTDTRGYPDA